eukprot:6195011-Pleurochrysis_carterae.AAC.5
MRTIFGRLYPAHSASTFMSHGRALTCVRMRASFWQRLEASLYAVRAPSDSKVTCQMSLCSEIVNERLYGSS